eukprot:5542216-Amphidinium_carterae.5
MALSLKMIFHCQSLKQPEWEGEGELAPPTDEVEDIFEPACGEEDHVQEGVEAEQAQASCHQPISSSAFGVWQPLTG